MSSKLGDSVSRKTALKILLDVSADYDQPIKDVRRSVESLWEGGLTPRARQALAKKWGITGGCVFAHNVGTVRKM